MTLSIKPLVEQTLPKEAIIGLFEDIALIRRLYTLIPIVATLYPIAHQILTRFTNYRKIKQDTKQLIVLHHALEALILTIATPFFTYTMIKTNFILDNESLGSDIISNLLLCFIFMVMYMYELASRCQHPRVVLVIHHLVRRYLSVSV